MKRYQQWRSKHLLPHDGVLVGADISQEWLLPWWWKRYKNHNSHPVAFADFGMSFAMKDWCKARGELIPLRIFDLAVKEKEEVAPQVIQQWEEECGKHFWDSRAAWFKKPLALLQTPFRKTVWIDLDCEILCSINPLFAYATPLAMAKNQSIDPPGYSYPIYNSGVIAFTHGNDLVPLWVKHCEERNHILRGDQEVFSELIALKKISIGQIPAFYNWSRFQDESSQAQILHWHGPWGKQVIRAQINNEQLCY